jgi:hypothetical protein
MLRFRCDASRNLRNKSDSDLPLYLSDTYLKSFGNIKFISVKQNVILMASKWKINNKID